MLLIFSHNTLCQYISIPELSKKKKKLYYRTFAQKQHFPFQEIDIIIRDFVFQLPNHISTSPPPPPKHHGKLRFLTFTLLFIEAKHNNNITKMKNNHDKISTTLYNLSLSLTLLSFSLAST